MLVVNISIACIFMWGVAVAAVWWRCCTCGDCRQATDQMCLDSLWGGAQGLRLMHKHPLDFVQYMVLCLWPDCRSSIMGHFCPVQYAPLAHIACGTLDFHGSGRLLRWLDVSVEVARQHSASNCSCWTLGVAAAAPFAMRMQHECGYCRAAAQKHCMNL